MIDDQTDPSIGNLIVLPLMSGFLKLSDPVIGAISLLSHIGTSLGMTFATSGLMLRLSKKFSRIEELTSTTIRL